MPTTTVLVTFDAEDTRSVIRDALPADAAVRYLPDLPEGDRADAVGDADYLLCFAPTYDLSDEEFDRLHGGQTLQLGSAGVDHVPFDRLPDGLRVCNNAGAHAGPIAEHVLALYLALAKRLPIEHRNLTRGEFNQFEPNRWVDGSICGIYGFGGIGEATARLLKPLGVEVHAINRSGESDEPTSFLGTPDDLDRVLERCDGLVITAPLTDETRGRIGRAELETMADDAFLINVGRGEIVDQRALYEHLEATPMFQAGIDAWWTEPLSDGEFALEYPLLDLPNVLGSAHNSAQVPDINEIRMRHAAGNLARAIEATPENVVDPERGY